ncbi:MAG: alpha/beta fold hydrolase [Myxococcales bacterium]|nr:alpha/beta fold hydrolase [Myxococcales bacterium]
MPEAPFIPPRWLASTHLQTACAALPFWAPPRSFRAEHTERVRVPLPSGGALRAAAWWQAVREPGARAPLAVVVHGVGGSSESRYVLRAAVALHRVGWHVLRLNLRGAGDSVPEASELYHAGLTEDLGVTVRAAAAREDVDGVSLLGFSLGGHVVIRLAGELGGLATAPGSALRAAVAVSAPLDLVETSRAIERRRSLPYHLYVLRRLVRQAAAFARQHPDRAHYRLSALRRLRSIRAFDELVVAPMHGFAGADDYYERVSAGRLIDRVRLPTLLVHASDDPVVPVHTLHESLRLASPFVETAWTARGGHVGWFEGISEASWVNNWAVERALAFLDAHAPAYEPSLEPPTRRTAGR